MDAASLQKTPLPYERFIDHVIEHCRKDDPRDLRRRDKGFAARLRRADNPATEYQSWELLASFKIDLTNENMRLPFVTVAAAIARARVERNGDLSLGRAIAACYPEGCESEPAKMRLRRLLACDDVGELCRLLRPLLKLIASRVKQPLDYLRLLRQLRGFTFDAERIKAQWAQDFYRQPVASDSEEEQA